MPTWCLEKQIFDESPFMMAIIQDFMIVYANKKIMDVIGIHPEELVIDGLQFTHPEETEKAKFLYRTVVEEKKLKSFQFKRRLVTRAGKVLFLDGFMKRCKWEGRDAGMVIFIESTTGCPELEISTDHKGKLFVVETVLKTLRLPYRIMKNPGLDKFAVLKNLEKVLKVLTQQFDNGIKHFKQDFDARRYWRQKFEEKKLRLKDFKNE